MAVEVEVVTPAVVAAVAIQVEAVADAAEVMDGAVVVAPRYTTPFGCPPPTI
jgi:hypothetical protein